MEVSVALIVVVSDVVKGYLHTPVNRLTLAKGF